MKLPLSLNDILYHSEAACAQPNIPDDLDFFSDAKKMQDRCKLVCANCPVQEKCRDFAIQNREDQGIWGGMTFQERRYWYKRQVRIGKIEPVRR